MKAYISAFIFAVVTATAEFGPPPPWWPLEVRTTFACPKLSLAVKRDSFALERPCYASKTHKKNAKH